MSDGTTPEHKAAAEKRAAAVEAAGDPGLVAALLREREGYVTRGLSDRVAQVDAALEAAGHKVEKPKARTRKDA